MGIFTDSLSYRMAALRSLVRPIQQRSLSTNSSSKPRHLLSLSNVTSTELATLINNATYHKTHRADTSWPLRDALSGQTIALLFAKSRKKWPAEEELARSGSSCTVCPGMPRK